MEARWTSNSKVVGSNPIRGVYFIFIYFFFQTELELEGGRGVILNPNRLPRVEGMATPAYHLCSCADGKLFLVHTNPQGCFTAVGRTESICS